MKEKYLKLVEAVSKTEDKDILLSALENCMTSFADYVNSIYAMEVLIPIQRHRLEGEDLRSYIEGLDSRRKACHNAAIANINMLNRIAVKVGVDPLYDEIIDGDNPSDRRKAANFCARMVMSIIHDQVTTGIDNTVEYLTKERKAC